MTPFFKQLLAALEAPKRIDRVLKDYQRLRIQTDLLEFSKKPLPVPEHTNYLLFS